MAGRNKGAVRQLSLQTDEKRKILRKQRSSDDGRRSVYEARPSCESRQASESWSEDKPVEVVATKCGQPRPVATRPPRSPLVPDQRTLVASRQEIAKRLRQAWAKSHNSNLEIYLTHDGDSDEDPTITPRTQIGCPSPDIRLCSNSSAPDSNKENRSSNSQVLEINAHCKELGNGSYSTDCSPYMSEEEDPPGESQRIDPEEEVSQPEKVTPCRLTAEERRMNFRNGFKRAISTSVSSTPPPTPTARRSPTIQQRPDSRPSSAKSNQGKKSPSPQVKRKLKKRRSRDGSKYGGGELVTMVSLVSPAESEAEELTPTFRAAPPPPCLDASKPPNPPPPTISLNKRPPFKVVPGMKSPSVHQGTETTFPPPPPRLPPAQPLPDPLIRRNNQTNSMTRTRSILRGSPGLKVEVTEKKSITFEENEEKLKEVKPVLKVKEEIKRVETKEIIETNEKDGMKFASPKEKECWELFNKITQKGIPVSFDTILRGMLTPTEYRLRKNALSR